MLSLVPFPLLIEILVILVISSTSTPGFYQPASLQRVFDNFSVFWNHFSLYRNDGFLPSDLGTHVLTTRSHPRSSHTDVFHAPFVSYPFGYASRHAKPSLMHTGPFSIHGCRANACALNVSSQHNRSTLL